MTTEVEFWVDPACPWCWVTARWIVDEVAPQRDLAITWQPISLLFKNDPAADSPYYGKVAGTLIDDSEPPPSLDFSSLEQRYRQQAKWADLANDRIKDYVFDWERMLATEGRTGPYLQYAHARIHSIFRRAAEGGIARAASSALVLAEPAERKLALELLDFGTAVLEAGESLRPHRLAGYLYDLATAFTAFFETCPVLKAPDETTRDSRLALCEHTARVLAQGLRLLGIAAPERM